MLYEGNLDLYWSLNLRFNAARNGGEVLFIQYCFGFSNKKVLKINFRDRTFHQPKSVGHMSGHKRL
jgi:hypothetical protein